MFLPHSSNIYCALNNVLNVVLRTVERAVSEILAPLSECFPRSRFLGGTSDIQTSQKIPFNKIFLESIFRKYFSKSQIQVFHKVLCMKLQVIL